MNIVIPDDYQHATVRLDCRIKLAGHLLTVLGDLARDPRADEVLAQAESLVLIRERTQIDDAFLQRTPKLKLISQTGKVARHIDLEACTRAGVAVVEGVGSPIAPAELTWTLIMAAQRQLVQASNDLHAGKWQTTIGTALHGRTLGIWGYGKIGKMIAGYGRAFGMRVQVWGRDASRAAAEADGYLAAASKADFFETSDVLTLHLRLVPDTTGIVTAGDLARMKPDALLVNTSRAELIEVGALERALKAGRPGFAALDVFEQEPVYDPAHPLLQMPNVLCTPHLGYVERGGYELYFGTAFDNVLKFAAGDHSQVLNPAALGG